DRTVRLPKHRTGGLVRGVQKSPGLRAAAYAADLYRRTARLSGGTGWGAGAKPAGAIRKRDSNRIPRCLQSADSVSENSGEPESGGIGCYGSGGSEKGSVYEIFLAA